MESAPKISYVLVCCIIFNLMIVTAPFFASLGLERAAFYNYLFFSPLCHQVTSRSFLLFGYQLAVCGRCVGVSVGVLSGSLLLGVMNRKRLMHEYDPKIFFMTCIPMGVDVLLNMTGFYTSPAFLRAATGFLVGMILPFYVVPGIFQIIRDCSARKKRQLES